MCDTLCALPDATDEGVTLFAKNSDRPPTEAQDVEWHPPRRDTGPVRTTYIEVDPHDGDTLGVLGSRPRWMWGMEHGVNEAGLAVGNEAIWTTRNPAVYPDALVGMDLVRLALERAPRARDGVDVIVDLLERHGQGGAGHEGGKEPYWSSFLLADPVEAFVVETSATDHAVEQVTRTRAISNRPTITAFDAEHGLRHELIDARVNGRLDASRACLAGDAVSVDRLRRHLRSHEGGDDGWTVCMHAGDEQATTAGIVAGLPATGPRIAHVVLGRPCRSLFVPVVVGQPLGDVPAWERFAALGDDLRPILDELEARLAADVRAEPGWNEEAWRRVHDVLDQVAERPRFQ